MTHSITSAFQSFLNGMGRSMVLRRDRTVATSHSLTLQCQCQCQLSLSRYVLCTVSHSDCDCQVQESGPMSRSLHSYTNEKSLVPGTRYGKIKSKSKSRDLLTVSLVALYRYHCTTALQWAFGAFAQQQHTWSRSPAIQLPFRCEKTEKPFTFSTYSTHISMGVTFARFSRVEALIGSGTNGSTGARKRVSFADAELDHSSDLRFAGKVDENAVAVDDEQHLLLCDCMCVVCPHMFYFVICVYVCICHIDLLATVVSCRVVSSSSRPLVLCCSSPLLPLSSAAPLLLSSSPLLPRSSAAPLLCCPAPLLPPRLVSSRLVSSPALSSPAALVSCPSRLLPLSSPAPLVSCPSRLLPLSSPAPLVSCPSRLLPLPSPPTHQRGQSCTSYCRPCF
jgi:hypothetical protein